MAQAPLRRQSIRGPIAFLREGTHDAAFLFALLLAHNIETEPDLPFFRQTSRGFEQFPGQAYGEGALAPMLRNIASELDTDPLVTERLRGIVIVCDAGERPGTALRRSQRAAKDAGFDAPAQHGAWSQRIESRPAVAIVLLPGPHQPGGLETLCRDYLNSTKPSISRCVDEFFRCVPPFDRPRTKEKQDKAAMVCATAALERDEPSMTMARAFFGRRPLVDVSHTTFASVADVLRSLLSSAPASAPRSA